MDRYPKDPDLEGLYVKRCKCGARPYRDRISIARAVWIACNCGRVGDSGGNTEEAAKLWNNDQMREDWKY